MAASAWTACDCSRSALTWLGRQDHLALSSSVDCSASCTDSVMSWLVLAWGDDWDGGEA